MSASRHAHTVERARRELADCRDGYSLPAYFYNDPELFEFEREEMLLDKWIFACHASELAEIGSFVTVDYAGESFIVVRAAENDINAFFNVCRHRGSRICTVEAGHSRRLTCPYHAWSYRLDGSLAPSAAVPSDASVDRLGLQSCSVAELEGLVFINPGVGELTDFDPFRLELSPFFALHGIDRSRVIARKHYDIDANWKLVLENFHECLHCAGAHSTFSRLHPSATRDTVPAIALDTEMGDWLEHVRQAGNDPGHVNDRSRTPAQPYRGHRRPYRKGFVTHTSDGRPAAPLMGAFTDYDGGNTGVVIEPFFSLQAANDHATLFSIVPRGALATRMTLSWLVDAEATDDQCDIDRIVEVWDVTTGEDELIVANNQAGTRSLRYEPGPYHPREQPTQDAVRWYLRQIEAAISRPRSIR